MTRRERKRDFRGCSISEFFNTIDVDRTFVSALPTSSNPTQRGPLAIRSELRGSVSSSFCRASRMPPRQSKASAALPRSLERGNLSLGRINSFLPDWPYLRSSDDVRREPHAFAL